MGSMQLCQRGPSCPGSTWRRFQGQGVAHDWTPRLQLPAQASPPQRSSGFALCGLVHGEERAGVPSTTGRSRELTLARKHGSSVVSRPRRGPTTANDGQRRRHARVPKVFSLLASEPRLSSLWRRGQAAVFSPRRPRCRPTSGAVERAPGPGPRRTTRRAWDAGVNRWPQRPHLQTADQPPRLRAHHVPRHRRAASGAGGARRETRPWRCASPWLDDGRARGHVHGPPAPRGRPGPARPLPRRRASSLAPGRCPRKKRRLLC